MPEPTYFDMPGAPGRYFVCAPYNSTMSTGSCAGMYRAEKGRQNGRHPHCSGCPIGAVHAGERPPAAAGMFGAKICPRCTFPATRIVRGVCVSCINREYEVVRGVNAKGSPPSRLKPLYPLALTYTADGESRSTCFPRVTGRIEAMLRVLRTQQGEVEFAWAPAVMPDLTQRDLFSPARARAAARDPA